MIDQLVQAHKQKQLILFVGAGVSMTLGLPSWRALIDHVAEELDFDPDVYRTLGSELALAEFYRITKGKIGPLRSWMDVQWHSNKIDISTSRVHKLIADAHLELIYTTNYDRWLEKAFQYHGKHFTKISGVGDLSRPLLEGTQIVKFHGDFDDDESIVLDETSYFDRLSFESPLDIKLRSDVLGKTVLFIGYSLSDINIRYMFYRLANIWKRFAPKGVQPTSYVFSSRPNVVQKAVLSQWNIEMISSASDNQEEGLVEFLAEIFK